MALSRSACRRLDNFFTITRQVLPGDEDSKKFQALLAKYYPNEQIFQVLGIGSARVVVRC